MTAQLRSSDNAKSDVKPAVQVGAICVDMQAGRVLLITSRGTGRWIIPKGWTMEGCTLPEAAEQEAWEEAGVRGDIRIKEQGRYDYDKIQPNGSAIPVKVHTYLLKVRKMVENYPEAGQRRRKWVSPKKAAEMVDEPGLKKILRNLDI